MAISRTVQLFLSAVIRDKDKASVLKTQESIFVSEDDVAAFRKVRDYYRRYRKFPIPAMVMRRCGFAYLKTREPLDTLYDDVVARAKYTMMRNAAAAVIEDLEVKDIEAAEQKWMTANTSMRLIAEHRDTGLYELSDVLPEVIQDFEEARMLHGIRGVTTGWGYVDGITGGLQNGDLWSIVARPGVGKTYLTLKMAFEARRAGKRVLYISPEVPKLQLARRLVGIRTGIDPTLIRSGRLSTESYRVMVDDVQRFRQDGPSFIIAAGNYKKSVPFINFAIEEYEPDVVYVDASYLVTPEKKRSGSGGRREVVSDTAEELKDSSSRYDRPICQTVQFNRQVTRSQRELQQANSQGNQNRNPIAHLSLDKIGETDVIGQVSSIVIGVEKGMPPNVETERIMGFIKGREGEQGWWRINYRHRPVDLSVITDGTQTIEEIDESEIDDYLDQAR